MNFLKIEKYQMISGIICDQNKKKVENPFRLDTLSKRRSEIQCTARDKAYRYVT